MEIFGGLDDRSAIRGKIGKRDRSKFKLNSGIERESTGAMKIRKAREDDTGSLSTGKSSGKSRISPPHRYILPDRRCAKPGIKDSSLTVSHALTYLLITRSSKLPATFPLYTVLPIYRAIAKPPN